MQAAKVGENLRRARERLGWTQEQMAAVLQVNVNTLKGWEIGRVEPTAARLRELVTQTGLDANFLLGHGNDLWGPVIKEARRALLAHLQTEPMAGNTFASRAGYTLRWLMENCPAGTSVLLSGILKVSKAEFDRIVSDGGDPIVGSAMEDLGEFTGIPPMWFATGKPEDLNASTQMTEEWLYFIRRCTSVGIKPALLLEHLGVLTTLMRQK